MDASPHLMAPTQEEEFKGDKRLASPQIRNSGFRKKCLDCNAGRRLAAEVQLADLPQQPLNVQILTTRTYYQ
jgi:hypothetical protein